MKPQGPEAMTVSAKYENGVFRPLTAVSIKEGTVVQVIVPAEPVPAQGGRSIRDFEFLGMRKVTIEIPDEKLAAFQSRVAAVGLTVGDWLMNLGEQCVERESIAHLQHSDPTEWARQFRAWADNHDPSLAVLSDEAMSRESIYPDRT